MVRAADHDRERTVRLLGEHMAAGRLSMAEFEERAAAAYASTVLADLDRLMVDLPPTSARPEDSPRSPGRQLIYRIGRQNGPWRGWLFTGAICLLIWLATSVAQAQLLYFWPVWVIGPWGAAIAWHTFAGCAQPRSVTSRRSR